MVNVWESRFCVDFVDLVLFEPGRSRFLVFMGMPFFCYDFCLAERNGGVTGDGLAFWPQLFKGWITLSTG